MTLKDLIVRVLIKEENKGSERLIPTSLKVNMMEHGHGSKPKKNTAKLRSKGGISKNKFKGKCFNCSKKGHRSAKR